MSKSTVMAASILLMVLVFSAGCQEEPVGAPCRPETDKGAFTKDLPDETYGVETRSVQCETAICVTKTANLYSDDTKDTAVSEFERLKDSQRKYSFCSCRCMDAEGHKYDRNNDKYDDLCECPPNTQCVSVLSNAIADAPEKVKGSYCIPNCIADGCTGTNAQGNLEECTPSSDSKEPWQWKCK